MRVLSAPSVWASPSAPDGAVFFLGALRFLVGRSVSAPVSAPVSASLSWVAAGALRFLDLVAVDLDGFAVALVGSAKGVSLFWTEVVEAAAAVSASGGVGRISTARVDDDGGGSVSTLERIADLLSMVLGRSSLVAPVVSNSVGTVEVLVLLRGPRISSGRRDALSATVGFSKAGVAEVDWGLLEVFVFVATAGGSLAALSVFVACSTVLDGGTMSAVLLGLASCIDAGLGCSSWPLDCVADGVGRVAAGRLLAMGAFGLKAPPPGFLSIELILQCPAGPRFRQVLIHGDRNSRMVAPSSQPAARPRTSRGSGFVEGSGRGWKGRVRVGRVGRVCQWSKSRERDLGNWDGSSTGEAAREDFGGDSGLWSSRLVRRRVRGASDNGIG